MAVQGRSAKAAQTLQAWLGWDGAAVLACAVAQPRRWWWSKRGGFWLGLQILLGGVLLASRMLQVDGWRGWTDLLELLLPWYAVILAYCAARHCASALDAAAGALPASGRAAGHSRYWVLLWAALPPLSWNALIMGLGVMYQMQRYCAGDLSVLPQLGWSALWRGDFAVMLALSLVLVLAAFLIGFLRLAWIVATAELFHSWRAVGSVLCFSVLVPKGVIACNLVLFTVYKALHPGVSLDWRPLLAALPHAGPVTENALELASLILILLLLCAWRLRLSWLARAGWATAMALTALGLCGLCVPPAWRIAATPGTSILVGLGSWIDNVGTIIAQYWPTIYGPHTLSQTPFLLFDGLFSFTPRYPILGVLCFSAANGVYALAVFAWLAYLVRRNAERLPVPAAEAAASDVGASQRPVRCVPTASWWVGLPVGWALSLMALFLAMTCIAPVVQHRQRRTPGAASRPVQHIPELTAAFTAEFAPGPAPAAGQTLGTIRGLDLVTGKVRALSDYRGRWVLLDLWASW